MCNAFESVDTKARDGHNDTNTKLEKDERHRVTLTTITTYLSSVGDSGDGACKIATKMVDTKRKHSSTTVAESEDVTR